MFGLLKKTLSGFLDKLTKREDEKPAQPQAAQEKELIEKMPGPEKKQEIGPEKKPMAEQAKEIEPEKLKITESAKKIEPTKAAELPKQQNQPQALPQQKQQIPEKPPTLAPSMKKDGWLAGAWMFGKKQAEEKEKIAEAIEKAKPQQAAEKTQVAQHMEKLRAPQPEEKIIQKPIEEKAKTATGEPEIQKPSFAGAEGKARAEDAFDLDRLAKKAESGQKKMEVKIGLAKTITTIFSPQVEITEGDVRDLMEELELSMLEADVAYDVALDITSKLRNRLIGMKVQKSSMQEGVRAAIADVLAGVLRSGKEFDLVEKVRGLPKPAKILFIGPNGAGKTTTMAKIAKHLADAKISCVFAAADTFRAAAIEQLEVHANRLGVPIIKNAYGSDPAAVAFDAIAYAKAHNIDAVLIDSSGRQDTNVNLLDELKKIARVAKPDLKIYIGESIGGNATVEQISGFAKTVGLDGVVLTKLDCDAKGGTALSVAQATGVPILYFGVGQEYSDLQKFDADALARQIVMPPSAS